MKTVLICHEGASLDQVGVARWLASFSDLSGIVVLRENWKHAWRRARREISRVGTFRFLDVLAFRAYERLSLSRKYRQWEQQKLQDLCRRYAAIDKNTPVLFISSPNASEAEIFIRKLSPNMMLARCKVLLKESVFTIPTKGTFVMHPGICPEYRNAYGCFWALANDDLNKVGMTLLRIDEGVDTGPIYGYYTYPFDELNEPPAVITQRVVFENLDSLRDKLLEIYNDSVVPVDASNRPSQAWGRPWLTKYLRWKRQARKRR